MGAELGATTSIFETDHKTLEYLGFKEDQANYLEIKADPDAYYDEKIVINLNDIVPMIAKPHSPDNVESISGVCGVKVNQVAIGSCTNSSYEDLTRAASILRNKKISDHVSLVIAPGSAAVFCLCWLQTDTFRPYRLRCQNT